MVWRFSGSTPACSPGLIDAGKTGQSNPVGIISHQQVVSYDTYLTAQGSAVAEEQYQVQGAVQYPAMVWPDQQDPP
jgi:hypothetical protein